MFQQHKSAQNFHFILLNLHRHMKNFHFQQKEKRLNLSIQLIFIIKRLDLIIIIKFHIFHMILVLLLLKYNFLNNFVSIFRDLFLFNYKLKILNLIF